MGNVNWFENGVQIFYPNAYHLVGRGRAAADRRGRARRSSTRTPCCCPGWARSSSSRWCTGSAAGRCSRWPPPRAAVSITSFYDMLWRGPLLPYATGVVLLPLVVVLLVDLLDAAARAVAGRAPACCSRWAWSG